MGASPPPLTQKPPQSFGTADVARLLGVQPARVRAIVRTGLCRPDRVKQRLRFTFQDVVLLRTAHGLLRAKVPMGRVRRALTQLTRQLSPQRPLSGVRIYADGREVMVRDGGASWKPDSGQLVLSFAVDELARAATNVIAVDQRRQRLKKNLPEAPDPAEEAAEWFETALDREQEGDLDGARAAYVEALTRDPRMSDAYVNLGRLAHESGDAATAGRLYHQAIECDPEDPVAHYNLAIALEDQGNLPAAVSHYQRAIETDNRFADAHFNLSRILDRLGRRVQALRHLMIYKKMTRQRR